MLKSLASAVARECARSKEVFLDVLGRALHGDIYDREAPNRSLVLYQNAHTIDDGRLGSVGHLGIRNTARDVYREPFDERSANTVSEGSQSSSYSRAYGPKRSGLCSRCGRVRFGVCPLDDT